MPRLHRARSLSGLMVSSLLTLAACATPPTTPGAGITPVASAEPGVLQASAYGLFLAGQSAANQGQSATAARYFGDASRAGAGLGAPDQGFLSLRAFTASLLSGDLSRAAVLAPISPGEDPALRHLGALVQGVEALAQGENKQARAILISVAADPEHEAGAALLAPIAAAAAGDQAASIAHPIIPGDAISQFFANLDQGKLFERARRFDEAETAFRALIGKGDPGGLASLTLGEMLERRGRRSEAAAIYATALGRDRANAALAGPRQRALTGSPPPPRMPTPREMAAQALLAPASELLAQKQDQVALAYLRMALRLDPARGEAWLLLGDVLSAAGDGPGARAAYAQPSPGTAQFVQAHDKLAWSLQAAGDKEAAVKTARETLAAAPGDQDAKVTLADLLRSDERYADSAVLLDGLIAAQGAAADWRLLYMRAVDLQESGRWPEAERDLLTALKLRPDEPELLNFLGYSWVDRGERLKEALAMVQKAVDLDPRSGAILDSLGWAYFRLGDFKTAVEKLESAIVLEPGDPDVNDHLGDAYWRIGRQIEARFQWRRVLTLEPSDKLKASALSKVAGGLAPAVTAAVVAGR